MSKRERFLAAASGGRPDRPPLGLWGHDYTRENGAAELAAETVARAQRYDWDFVKIQIRYTCFAECWGAEWRPSGATMARPALVRPAVRDAADLEQLAVRTPDLAALREQLDALRLVRRALPDDRPVLMTVFSPLMVLPYCFPEEDRRAVALAALRADPARATRVLAALAKVVTWFASAALEAGADGIFYATNLATADLCTVEEVRRFQRPFDLPILEGIAGAPLNLVHVCGERVHLGEFVDYPVSVLSWAQDDGNPGLAAIQARTGRAVAGGITARLATAPVAAVARDIRAAIRATRGAGLLLAPSCSIDPETTDATLRAVTAAARASEQG